MLVGLIGCQSVERILYYLLVNGECYPSQLHRMLNTPLTPIQKALERLEKASIVHSRKEGKMRVYQFNKSYPLFKELETLLQGAFHRLPMEEKQKYTAFFSHQMGQRRESNRLLRSVWEDLKRVRRVKIVAKTGRKNLEEWGGKAEGEVAVSVSDHSLIFQEQGEWVGGQAYRNSYRWTRDPSEGTIALEHLHHGIDRPVLLFQLLPTKCNFLESAYPQFYKEGTYFGWLKRGELYLQLFSRTIGPRKNEKVESIYF